MQPNRQTDIHTQTVWQTDTDKMSQCSFFA